MWLPRQSRFYFVFIAEFVERLPTIFPVNIWITNLFEIEHRRAKWLISDPSPKGTRWINDLSLDHADQWSDESLSRVDLIDHWSENGFARKERHRSEILIRILPKERTLSQWEHFFLDIRSLFCCLTTRSLDVEHNVTTAYCKSSSGDGVDWLFSVNKFGLVP